MTPEQAALFEVVRALEGLGVPHMVTGSVASSYHGRPRSSHGADIVIDPTSDQLDALVGSLLPVAVASPEDTILSKLEWAKKAGRSEKQIEDAAGVLAVNPGVDRATSSGGRASSASSISGERSRAKSRRATDRRRAFADGPTTTVSSSVARSIPLDGESRF